MINAYAHQYYSNDLISDLQSLILTPNDIKHSCASSLASRIIQQMLSIYAHQMIFQWFDLRSSIVSERRWQRRVVSICHRWSNDENISQWRVSLCPIYLEYVQVNEHLRNFQVSNWILWLEIILQRKYLVPREKLWLRKDKMDWSPRRQLRVNLSKQANTVWNLRRRYVESPKLTP